jgi:hypothetical protein
LLDTAFFRAATVGSHRIEDVKEALGVLIEDHFKVGRAASAKITRTPFNVKLPVRSRTRGRGENAAAAGKSRAVGYLSGGQVVLIREDGLAQIGIRQGTTCVRVKRVAGKLQIAIGADVRTSKGLPVKSDREWERDAGGAIVAMVACICGPRNDRARPSRRGIVAAWGPRWRWRRRWAGQGVDEICARRHTSWRVGACGIAPYLGEVRRVLLHSYREGAIRPS